MAQWIEHQIPVLRVGGSSPFWRARESPHLSDGQMWAFCYLHYSLFRSHFRELSGISKIQYASIKRLSLGVCLSALVQGHDISASCPIRVIGLHNIIRPSANRAIFKRFFESVFSTDRANNIVRLLILQLSFHLYIIYFVIPARAQRRGAGCCTAVRGKAASSGKAFAACAAVAAHSRPCPASPVRQN